MCVQNLLRRACVLEEATHNRQNKLQKDPYVLKRRKGDKIK